MARHNIRKFIVFAGMSALADASLATQPPCATSDGGNNTACGTGTLISNAGGDYNTASGAYSLASNMTGNRNTASGFRALYYNLSGAYNTANGASALHQNSTGRLNTANGFEALLSNNGDNNTASGSYALFNNTSGSFNTASGTSALAQNTIGAQNTASGSYALYSNMSGSYNTASGNYALHSNSIGQDNSALGYKALYSNTSGISNTAYGEAALFNSNGSNNTAMGYEAGYNLETGSNTIEIGNKGAAGDNKLIRIGTEGTQTKAFIAGIFGNHSVSGLAVVIGSNGELGAVSSSERFKTAIEPMGSNTEKLQQLRPVTFHYKVDPQGTLRYGLIAEEVAKVYPELVVRDQNGRIDGVRYDELAPMLLNEVQKQQQVIAAEHEHAMAQDAEVHALKAQLAEMHAALTALQTEDQLLARR